MNLREWLEDKIRENSWENRLNEESPYEDNAISIAKPILKRAKNGKIAVDKKRTKLAQEFAEKKGQNIPELLWHNPFDLEGSLANYALGSDWSWSHSNNKFFDDLEKEYPGITKDIIVESQGMHEVPSYYNDYAKKKDRVSRLDWVEDKKFETNPNPKDYFSEIEYMVEDGEPFMWYDTRHIQGTELPDHSITTKEAKKIAQKVPGAQFTIQELLDYLESQKPEAIKKYKQGLEQKKLDDIASDFE